MGTSVSCPIFAGVISLINDLRLQQGLPVLGFVNPRLYQTAAAHVAEAFQQMSSGSSSCDAGGDCCSTGYPVLSNTVWNPVTGLGWPKWAGLSKYLAASP
jgi:tripeptidyl-peptidase-1